VGEEDRSDLAEHGSDRADDRSHSAGGGEGGSAGLIDWLAIAIVLAPIAFKAIKVIRELLAAPGQSEDLLSANLGLPPDELKDTLNQLEHEGFVVSAQQEGTDQSFYWASTSVRKDDSGASRVQENNGASDHE
jgi:hypothetical protein